MSRMDITVGRDVTINVGNYSSIKPSVAITMKDVNAFSFDKEYEKLSDLADALIALETIKMGDEMDEIVGNSYKTYLKALKNHKKNIEKAITDFVSSYIVSTDKNTKQEQML
jgi:hypothetical protein